MKPASELELIHAMLPLQLEMAICYLYESAYFPAPYADNQLLYSLCDPKRSHAFNSASFKHNNQVEQWIVQLLQFHPKNTPELISEGQKSKAFPQTPLADALRALKSHNGTLLFKILDPPLPCQCNDRLRLIVLVVRIWKLFSLPCQICGRRIPNKCRFPYPPFLFVCFSTSLLFRKK